MDQVQPTLPKRCSTLGLHLLCIVFLSLVSMCHSAIKDPQPKYQPDNVATEYPLDTNAGWERKQPPCTGNCEAHSKMEIRLQSLLKKDSEVNDGDDVIYKINGTDGPDDETGIKVSYTEDEHHWKVKVIIVCTITASIEVVIVIFILIYWRDIRWSMRKMYCPCDERRVRRRDHQAMEPSGPSPSDSGFHGDDLEQGQQVQTYQTRGREDADPLEEQPLQTSVV